jgi:hypothetical protein
LFHKIIQKKGEGNMRKLAICLIVSVVLMSFAVAGIAGTAEKRRGPQNDKFLTQLIPGFLVKPHEAYEWHLYKDMGGPTYSGSPSWKSYMEFLEWKLEEYGVRDIQRNPFSYNRWYTSDWPDKSQWSLISNGVPINVASYSAYSGSTGDAGLTAELIYYNPASPPTAGQMAGKIVVFKTLPHPVNFWTLPVLQAITYALSYTFQDYEYTSNPETFGPIYTVAPNDVSINGDVWYQLNQTTGFNNILRANGAGGGIIVFDQSYDRLAGLYQFGVPTLGNVPTLFLDRVAGAQVIADAQATGRSATLRLVATVKNTETYQLFGYLPGRNYGTPEDEMILLTTHTEGPSISQENGAFGILGIIKYFSNIPQSERPRTLMIFLDNRHYMPGMETFWSAYNLPDDMLDPVVATIGTEHLGQLEYHETGVNRDIYEQTGRVETAFLWTRNNQTLIDMAIKAVIDNEWPRCQVKAIERPGIHNEHQGTWYGLGNAQRYNRPGFGTMGTQGAYWSTRPRIEAFDADLFYSQVATMAQLTGSLMLADKIEIDPVWGILRSSVAPQMTNPILRNVLSIGLADSHFVDPNQAATQRTTLLSQSDQIFAYVKERNYSSAKNVLDAMRLNIVNWVVAGTKKTSVLAAVDNAIAKLPTP